MEFDMSLLNKLKSQKSDKNDGFSNKSLLKKVGVSADSKVIKKENATLSKLRGFSDLLGYAMFVDDYTLMLKDGSLQVAFKFFGKDFNAITDELRLHETFKWTDSVVKHGNNLMIEFDTFREKAGEYPDDALMNNPISQIIEQERKWQYSQSGQLFETNTYITLTYTPDQELSVKSRRFLYDTDEEIKEKTIQEISKEFKDKVEQFICYVSSGDQKRFIQLEKDAYTS